MGISFRKLKASEIEARVNTVSKKGCSLLLFKDARTDQNILDETVGCLNWKRSHQLIGDRLYCTVEIWDAEKEQWISKQDVGTESYTEKEKGQASDSFKRACFNLGIGRELYTAPFIWINAKDITLEEYNGKFTTKDRFMVDSIGYDKNRNINKLVIRKLTWNGVGDIVYQFGEPETQEELTMKEYEEVGKQKINKTDVQVIKKTYTTDEQIFNILKHFDIKKLEDMTVNQFVELQKVMEGKR